MPTCRSWNRCGASSAASSRPCRATRPPPAWPHGIMPSARLAHAEPDRPQIPIKWGVALLPGRASARRPPGHYKHRTSMLKKLILVVAIFLVILLALSFGETVFREVFAWISSLTGVLIRNFGDLYFEAMGYLRAHTGKVVLALVL